VTTTPPLADISIMPECRESAFSRRECPGFGLIAQRAHKTSRTIYRGVTTTPPLAFIVLTLAGRACQPPWFHRRELPLVDQLPCT
jgi:hypothetical protein